MAYLGLVPSERSTGESVRRGSITKAGNGRVRHSWSRAPGPIDIRRRAARPSSTSWSRRRPRCTRRLAGPGPPHARYRALSAKGKKTNIVLHCDRPRTGRLHVVGRSGGAASMTITCR